jgi:hypothetical protein
LEKKYRALIWHKLDMEAAFESVVKHFQRKTISCTLAASHGHCFHKEFFYVA